MSAGITHICVDFGTIQTDTSDISWVCGRLALTKFRSHGDHMPNFNLIGSWQWKELPLGVATITVFWPI